MKPLVIYHANCADGFGAAFAAWLKLGDEAEYLPMEYNPSSHKHIFCHDREVYILDFSFPKPVMDAIFQHAQRVVWLDHHASVFKDWGVPLDGVADELTLGLVQPIDHTVILDNSKSGAMLAWGYFHPDKEVPMLIKHIDDRDRWQFKLDGSREIHAVLTSLKPWTFEQWSNILAETSYRANDGTGVDALYRDGAVLLRSHKQLVRAALKRVMPAAIRKWNATVKFEETFRGLAVNASFDLASDLGHELAKKSGTFGLVWSMAADGKIHCSLRSNGDYDVSAIAKVFGGGGHRNAAGFSTDIDVLMGWLK